MFTDKALIKSYFIPTCPRICRNICLICACHRLFVIILYKFFLTKFPFVQSRPIFRLQLMEGVGGDFEQFWGSLFDRNVWEMNWLFLHLEKRGCSGLNL